MPSGAFHPFILIACLADGDSLIHDGKADCSDVLYIFSVRMPVYHVLGRSVGKFELDKHGVSERGMTIACQASLK